MSKWIKTENRCGTVCARCHGDRDRYEPRLCQTEVGHCCSDITGTLKNSYTHTATHCDGGYDKSQQFPPMRDSGAPRDFLERNVTEIKEMLIYIHTNKTKLLPTIIHNHMAERLNQFKYLDNKLTFAQHVPTKTMHHPQTLCPLCCPTPSVTPVQQHHSTHPALLFPRLL